MWNSDQKNSSTGESDEEDGDTEHGTEADYMDRLAAKTCVQTTDGSESEERDNSCVGDESDGEDQGGKRSLPRVCEIPDETEGHSIRGMHPVELGRKAAKRTHAQLCRGPEGVLAILEEEGSDRDTGTPKRSRRNSGDKGKGQHPSRRDPQKSQRRNKKNAAGPGTSHHDKHHRQANAVLPKTRKRDLRLIHLWTVRSAEVNYNLPRSNCYTSSTSTV